MKKMPEFKLTLQARKSPHMLEKKPRYDVLVNGIRKGELYFNMRGYRGALPDVHGCMQDLGEAPLSAYRRQVAALNREAQVELAKAAEDRSIVLETYDTAERDKVVVALGETPVAKGSAGIEMRTVNRRDLEYAQIFFDGRPIPASFLSRSGTAEPVSDENPCVDLIEGDKVLAAVDTEDPAFVLLAIGQVPAGMGNRPMQALDQDSVADAAREFAWLTRMAWRELQSAAGRNLVNADALPLIEGRTLPEQTRPSPNPAPKHDWIWSKLPRPEAVSEESPGF